MQRVDADTAQIEADGKLVTLARAQRQGRWTLVELLAPGIAGPSAAAVLEDFSSLTGALLLVDSTGAQLALGKTAEATRADPTSLYLGHTREDLLASPQDMLARELLARPGDPSYAKVAGVFEPLQRMPTYSFIGTPDTIDKVPLAYGGRSPDFDPATMVTGINAIRRNGQVLDGLVGGHLPIERFVYPEANGNWTELLAFAPFRIDNDNERIQPVWYRVARIEQGALRWVRYVDSYQPFPPRAAADPQNFYADLVALERGWAEILRPAMRVELPDQRVADMARFALVRDLMTRVGDYPKYGAVDKDYAGSEHDGFPDTFTVDMEALLDWGLVERAGRYLDNYLGRFVRDDGSLLYRGPEIGQYGRMLTEFAHYVDAGGDAGKLLNWRTRIDGITQILLGLRAKAQRLPATDAAYGMIAGWSEADACLDPEPQRYMQPYFSNSSEAARGFRDLGRVWQRLGAARGDAALAAFGVRLQREAGSLRADLQAAIGRSILTMDGERVLPAIAGVKEPFHVAVPRDTADPQFRSYRAYMEMLYSGNLTRDEVRGIVDYRSNHHDLLLGMPTAYGYRTADVAGFLTYGHGFGLIQHDFIREALLLTWANMAHEYTRGTWTAPETRNLLMDGNAAPYATPAQLVAALLTRWLLVFEDPESETLWLGKGIPREWLGDGKNTAVAEAPTRWGRVGFELRSHLAAHRVDADLILPPGMPALTKLRLRLPEGQRIRAVLVDGRAWRAFDAAEETISIPAGISGTLHLGVTVGN